MKKQKPMLAVDATESLNDLKYPKLASKKLDGIRVWFHPELGIVGRSLKPIRNIQLKEKMKSIQQFAVEQQHILDGEFYAHELTFQEITRAVMTTDFTDPKKRESIILEMEEKTGKSMNDEEYEIYWKSLIEKINFYMFEVVDDNSEFEDRYGWFSEINTKEINIYWKILEQVEVTSAEDVTNLFADVIEQGYEGIILRNPLSPYKYGRSTLKEEHMLKVKPFETFDAQIIDVTERFTNLNEAEINELGYSYRVDSKDDKDPTGLAATFVVDYNGKEVKVVITGTEAFRKEIWNNRSSYIGRYIEYKGMLIGSKDRPRHPGFIRFREDKDDK